MSALAVVPVTIAEANAYVIRHHRHNGPLPTARLVCGLVDDTGTLRGVGIAGLPKARMLMGRYTLEVNRVCTDGAPNGCSILYGALVRAAKALGYRRLITFTLESEPGSSLRAVGWVPTHSWDGGSWIEMRGTGIEGAHDLGPKIRWELQLPTPEWLLPELDTGLDVPSAPTLFDEISA